MCVRVFVCVCIYQSVCLYCIRSKTLNYFLVEHCGLNAIYNFNQAILNMRQLIDKKKTEPPLTLHLNRPTFVALKTF